MVSLRGLHLPERQPGAIVARIQLQRGLEKRGLTRGLLRQQPLHVLLERVQRRTRRPPSPIGRLGPAADRPPRHSLDEREQIAETAALGDLGVRPADVNANRAGVDGERITIDADVADDNLVGADELTDLDHRRAAQDRVRRQVQLVVGARARGARNRPEPAPVHVVGHQDRDRLAEPVDPAVAPGRVERDDEDPRRRRRDGRRLGRWRGRRRRAKREERAQKRDDHAATALLLARPARVTETTQPCRAPDARHSLTRASADTSNSCRTRAMAAA